MIIIDNDRKTAIIVNTGSTDTPILVEIAKSQFSSGYSVEITVPGLLPQRFGSYETEDQAIDVMHEFLSSISNNELEYTFP